MRRADKFTRRPNSIHVVAGDYEKSKSRLAAFDKFLDSSSSFFNMYRPKRGVQSATVFNQHETRHIEPERGTREPNYNPFFDFLYIFSTPHTEWDVSHSFTLCSPIAVLRNRSELTPSLRVTVQLEDLPYNARIYREHIYSDDLPDRRAPQNATAKLHAKWGVSTDKGAIVVVRPDGYVGCVTTLDAAGFDGLNAYFAGFMAAPSQVRAAL